MSIEDSFARIATALEIIAGRSQQEHVFSLQPDVAAKVQTLAAEVNSVDAPEVAEAEAPKRGRGRPRKEDSAPPAADTPPASPPSTPAPAVTAAPTAGAEQEPAVTYDDVQPLILRIAAEHGRPKVLEFLKGFGVPHGKDLKAEQYPAVVKAALALLEPEDVA